VWHFFEDLLSQVTSLNAFVEFNKLDNVSGHCLASLISQRAIIAIELFHRRKVRIANSNDND